MPYKRRGVVPYKRQGVVPYQVGCNVTTPLIFHSNATVGQIITARSFRYNPISST